MRPLLVKLHRWFGIGIALFLTVSGLTGAIIAWNGELDAALNPDFYFARTPGPALPPLTLAARVETANPRVQVTYLPLGIEPGRTLLMRVQGRTDPVTHEPYELGFNQIAVDPATGAIQGRREWGAFSLSRLNLIPFLYELHYTLYLPLTFHGVTTGAWLLGIVAIVWLLDSVIALALAFPSVKAWRKSFAFRLRRGGYALTFDLHRSGGVWIWGLLVVLATTSISMNLPGPVMRPLVSFFSSVTPSPFFEPSRLSMPKPGGASLPRQRIVALAAEAGDAARIAARPGGILFVPAMNVYGVGYFSPGGEAGESPLGNPWMYWDGATGARIVADIPGRGSAGDTFLQAQFPLHSGRIAGLPGRIAISFIGVMVAVLSVTGLAIWLRKRQARQRLRPGRARTA